MLRGVDSRHLVEHHPHIGHVGEDRANRRGDVGRRQGSGRDLVEQGLEQVVVAPVHQRDLDRLSGQPLGGGQPAEAGADNNDLGDGATH